MSGTMTLSANSEASYIGDWYEMRVSPSVALRENVMWTNLSSLSLVLGMVMSSNPSSPKPARRCYINPGECNFLLCFGRRSGPYSFSRLSSRLNGLLDDWRGAKARASRVEK